MGGRVGLWQKITRAGVTTSIIVKIVILFIMPPIARIVYYFVHRTNKLSILFSAIQNQNIYLCILISVNCGLASGW